MKVTLLAVVLVIFLVSSAYADMTGPNLIQNGSFEQPGFSGNFATGQQKVTAPSTEITNWHVGGTGDVFVVQGPDNGPLFTPAQDGLYYVDLSGDGLPHAVIYQDFPTTVGYQYLLKFYIGSAGQPLPQIINVLLKGNGSLLNTKLTALAHNANGIDWLEEDFTFVADSTSTRLGFIDTSTIDDNTSFVDNVSVVATGVPEPATFGLLITGSILLLRRHRG